MRTLTSTCEFENLKDGLKRDRVICGIRNQALKERLLREASLTLKSAVDIRRAAEVSREQVKSLTNSPHANIDELNQSGKQSYQHRNYSAQQRNESNTVRLFNCGNCGQQHAAKSCPAYGKRCNNCHNIGHFAKLCRSTKNTRFRNPVREVEYEVECNLTEHGIDTINTSGSSQHGNINTSADTTNNVKQVKKNEHVSLRFNNKTFSFKLDTGAETNILSRADFEKVVPKRQRISKLRPSNAKLTAYGGHSIPILGRCFL